MLNRRIAIVAVVIPLIGLIALLGWKMAQGQFKGGAGPAVFTRLGEVPFKRQVPLDFSLTLLDGRPLATRSLIGQVVMVDFWASWCPPCRQEAPLLQRTWEAYRDQGVTFLGVAVWDNEAEINSFLQRYGITYPVSFDSQGKIAVDFGLTGLPEKYFFDRDGILRRKFIGPMTEEALREALELFLAEGGGGL